LKVDVEGYEASVFQGAQKLLSEQRVGVVFFESCPALTRSAGFDPLTPSQMLLDYGYALYRVNADGELVPATLKEVHQEAIANWAALTPEISSMQ
jgi:hypothetical protein